VPRFTASDYLSGTFSLIPLYGLSLDGIKEKVSKMKSEAVNQGTDNTMVLKKKYQRGNQKP
jgi:hypothetical protein